MYLEDNFLANKFSSLGLIFTVFDKANRPFREVWMETFKLVKNTMWK